MKVLSIKPHKGEYLITCEDGWFRKRERKFWGDCTVWHELPNMKRPGTMAESFLSNVLTKYKYETINF